MNYKKRSHAQKQITLSIITALIFLAFFDSQIYSQLAKGHEKFLGNVYGNYTIHPTYDSLWNQMTPENRGKWIYNEPGRDIYEWDGLDVAYNYAINRNMPFKEHTLVWGTSQGEPYWIQYLDSTEQAEEVEEWIQLVAQRYPATSHVDVVNEPLHQYPVFADALGGEGSSGWDWVIWCFQKARQYFPDSTKLILNDYNLLNGYASIDTFLQLINLLKADSLIDGIGVQGHSTETTSAGDIQNRLDLLAAAGLPIYISEYDVNLADDSLQLAVYQQQFPVFWNHPAVKGVTIWGYVQGQTWRPNTYLLRTGGSERPALQWLRTYLTESDIQKGVNLSPTDYMLSQNHPNPFNPTTTIHYSLRKSTKVRLTVYNVRGEKIRTLIDGYHGIGEYSVTWDALNDQKQPVASGIYFYRLTAGEFSFEKRMLLIR